MSDYRVTFVLDSINPDGSVTKVRYDGSIMDGDKGTISAELMLRLGIGPIISMIVNSSASAATDGLNSAEPVEKPEDSIAGFMAAYGKGTEPIQPVEDESAKKVSSKVTDAAIDVLASLDIERVTDSIFEKLGKAGGLLHLRNFYLAGYHRTELDATGAPVRSVPLDKDNMKSIYTGKVLEWMEAVAMVMKHEGFWQQLATRVSTFKKVKKG